MTTLDTIDVQGNVFRQEDGTEFHSIALVLNGEVFERAFDAMVFACVGDTDQEELEIITCSCGVPGCAGIFSGLNVRRWATTVEWNDIDSGLPKELYCFDAQQYNETVNKTFVLMREIAETREAANLPYEEQYDGILSFWNVDGYEKDIVSTNEWFEKRSKK